MGPPQQICCSTVRRVEPLVSLGIERDESAFAVEPRVVLAVNVCVVGPTCDVCKKVETKVKKMDLLR